ncbi:sufE-like protein 2, chloroplastic [Vigna unguiculata]|uniref:Quinolinate synthase n=1 Tax=Vigna unguiculata TaxID=3917 RepID=A0A4D6NMR1_VIGUN|nr:sufE-like protein 2, chloroplastic [Vigna unguiculata]QCE13147.1 quinolinate synthase [Vigna unguiculata]
MVSSTAVTTTTLFTPSSSSSSFSSSSYSSSYSSSSFSSPLSPKPNTFTPSKSNAVNAVNALCTKPKLRSNVADKLNNIASEFTSLSQPIDRVKRLLHYASLLPPFLDADRVPANRVVGCATQVWVVAEIDERRRMRFRADSDSEISKGFCWCLVWILDGAKPEEVLMVDREDLADVNVGLGMSLKAHSRTNTWHNVLFTMQTAAKDLL